MSNETERSDVEILSELFKGSSRPIDLTSESDPEEVAIEALYQQAVKAAQDWGWPAPSRTNVAERYREEIAASRKNQ